MNMQKEKKCKKSKYVMQHTCAGPSPKLAQGRRSELLDEDSEAGTLFVLNLYIFILVLYLAVFGTMIKLSKLFNLIKAD
jgi:hypothetical protein